MIGRYEYEIVKPLNHGRVARLVLARTTIDDFERYVVIKEILAEHTADPQFVEMFLHETKLAATLHHQNIVQVHDVGQDGTKTYLVMDYVHGEDLCTILRHASARNESVPLEHVITIVIAVAAALHHAHEQRGPDAEPLGIVHCDVSPANILVGYDGNVKVVDFGIAKVAHLKLTEATRAGSAPPAQCTDQLVDRRSDVFALGIVLYELATARRQFHDESDSLTMRASIQDDVPRPSLHRPDLALELEPIILKALAIAPADRFQTADEMRVALEQFAISARIQTSMARLAGYMEQQFGQRLEPWEADAWDVKTMVDGDEPVLGVAQPPNEAVKTPTAIQISGVANRARPDTHRDAIPKLATPSAIGSDRVGGPILVAGPSPKKVALQKPIAAARVGVQAKGDNPDGAAAQRLNGFGEYGYIEVVPTVPIMTKGLRIPTRCTTIEQFVATFHRFCEPSAVFISTSAPRPVGIETAFSIDLADGRPALTGLGVVTDVWTTPDNRFRRRGMCIKIRKLTSATRPVFEQLLLASSRALTRTTPAAGSPIGDAMPREYDRIDSSPIDLQRPITVETAIVPAIEPALSPAVAVRAARSGSDPDAIAGAATLSAFGSKPISEPVPKPIACEATVVPLLLASSQALTRTTPAAGPPIGDAMPRELDRIDSSPIALERPVTVETAIVPQALGSGPQPPTAIEPTISPAVELSASGFESPWPFGLDVMRRPSRRRRWIIAALGCLPLVMVAILGIARRDDQARPATPPAVKPMAPVASTKPPTPARTTIVAPISEPITIPSSVGAASPEVKAPPVRAVKPPPLPIVKRPVRPMKRKRVVKPACYSLSCL